MTYLAPAGFGEVVAHAAPPPTYPIASVDNALRLIATLRDRGALRLSEASEVIGCGRSTAHRLLAMLTYHGFADQDPKTRVYRMGDALASLEAVPRTVHTVEIARPVLQVLSRATKETVHLSQLRGGSVVFLDSVESSDDGRTGSRRGVAYPAHCTSGGKALLAHVEPELLPRVLGGARLERLTPASIGTLGDLQVNLAHIRKRRYALNQGESQPGVIAVAVAVRPGSSLPDVALSVAGRPARMKHSTLQAFAETLHQAAELLGQRLDRAVMQRSTTPLISAPRNRAGAASASG